MSKRKKRKLSKFGKFFISILFLFILFFIYNVKKNSDNELSIINTYSDLNNANTDIKNNSFIVDTYESDKDSIVKEYFAEGMSLNNFNKVLEQKENYIKKNGNFQNIAYDFNSKLHYSDLEKIYNNINNSSIANVEIVGKSVDNRNIYGIEIGKGDILYIDANIHAAEVANTLIITKFLSEVVNSYESNNSEIVNILDNIKIVAIPCINPDGYEVYNYGIDSLNNKELWWYVNKDKYNFSSIKSNANGVDLNRNFPTQNAGLFYKTKNLISSVSLIKTTSSTAYFGGSSLGSEPETQASMYFMLKHFKNVYAYLNMHSQGRVIYAGKPNLSTEFNSISQSLSNTISKTTSYLSFGLDSEEVGEGNDGSATDFMAELANGFKYSPITGRLSSNKYVDNSSSFTYRFPVLTIETLITYTTDTSVFKNEYYNYGIRNALFYMLEYNN